MTYPTALSAIDRQNRIIELLAAHGSVQVDDLVRLLGVSTKTVHRDLDALEIDGRLRKAHGGLLALPALRAAVAFVLVTDFLYGRAVNARSATYVVSPSLNICCAPTTRLFRRKSRPNVFSRDLAGRS